MSSFLGEVNHQIHIGIEDPADVTGAEEEILSVFRKVRNEIKEVFTKFYFENIEPALSN